MISSGRNKLLATPPPGLKYGSVKTPSAPSRGNTVSVRGTSCGFMRDLASCRRKRMLPSTKRRSERVAPYGAPGVDSSMYRPYSGWKTGMQALRAGERIVSFSSRARDWEGEKWGTHSAPPALEQSAPPSASLAAALPLSRRS